MNTSQQPEGLDAESIANSDRVIKVFASPEWRELSFDGQEWVRAIIAETLERAALTRPTPAAVSVSVEEIAGLHEGYWATPGTFDSDHHLSEMAFIAGAQAILSRLNTPQADKALNTSAEPVAETPKSEHEPIAPSQCFECSHELTAPICPACNPPDSLGEDAALAAFLIQARADSVKNYGPGERTVGVCNHIRKELVEIEEVNGADPVEWMDVVILAFDGAMRAGHEPADLLRAWRDKQALNQTRTWPDWRTLAPDAPIEHVRDAADSVLRLIHGDEGG
jgi:hypothetical protein